MPLVASCGCSTKQGSSCTASPCGVLLLHVDPLLQLLIGIELLIYAGLWVRYVVAWMYHAAAEARDALMLVPHASATNTTAPPHIFHVIVDDLGWGNTATTADAAGCRRRTWTRWSRTASSSTASTSTVHAVARLVPHRQVADASGGGLCSPTDVHCGAPNTVTTIAQRWRAPATRPTSSASGTSGWRRRRTRPSAAASTPASRTSATAITNGVSGSGTAARQLVGRARQRPRTCGTARRRRRRRCARAAAASTRS